MRKETAMSMVVCVIFMASGCATDKKFNTISGVKYPSSLSFKKLKRDEYQVIKRTKGEGCVESWGFNLFIMPFFFSDYKNEYGKVEYQGIGFWNKNTSLAKEIAYYDAISKVARGADALIGERWHVSVEGANYFFYWKYKTCAVVTAKAVNIKTEEEITVENPLNKDKIRNSETNVNLIK